MRTSAKVSAGLLMYRQRGGSIEVFLGHPGGPYFAKKDDGFWTIPKGLIEAGQTPLQTALREFHEETGLPPPPASACRSLGLAQQAGGKTIHGWTFEGDVPDNFNLVSNQCEIEWPPRSGRTIFVPEIDRAMFFDMDSARLRINPAQVAFLDRLTAMLATSS